MSWTEFAAVMDDGKEFFFATTYSREFFNMPEGYRARSIKKIIPHESRKATEPIYRERPFFECFVDGL